jgi:hypothetical protein
MWDVRLEAFIGEFLENRLLYRMFAEVGVVVVFAGGTRNHLAEGLEELHKGTTLIFAKEGEADCADTFADPMKKCPKDWTPLG